MHHRRHGASCKTCRRRGRKCTRELPECRSCLDKGIKCEGYTLKWTGLASRGKLAGKTSMTLKPTTSSTEPQRQCITNDNVEQLLTFPQITTVAGSSVEESLQMDEGELESPQMEVLPEQEQISTEFEVNTSDLELFQSYMVPDSNHLHLNDLPGHAATPMSHILDPYNVPMELKFILNYHLLEVAPRLCVDNNTMRNPYSQYILPLAVQRPALLYACAALAACHFSVRLANQQFHIDCLRFRGKSLKRLSEQLWSEQNAKDESNIATVLMLTLTDMCLGGFSNFNAHFSAARRLIDLRGSIKTQDSFVEQYIAWLDIMSAASDSRKPMFTSREVKLLRGSSSNWSYDVFPCPPDQFEVISEIVELGKSQDDLRNPSVEAILKISEIKAKVLALPLHNERGESWLHLTEAYRHAIVLYMTRLFQLSIDDDELAWLTQSVFYHAKHTPAATGWADHLLWPLFHAGLEFRDARRQQWLRDRSQLMQKSGGFRNVETVMNILERVWSSDATPDYLTLLSSETLGNMVAV